MDVDSKQIHVRVLSLTLRPQAAKKRLLLIPWCSRKEVGFSFRDKLKKLLLQRSLP